MNTIFVMIFFNLFLIFSRWNVAASENEDCMDVPDIHVRNQIMTENEEPSVISSYFYDDQTTTIIDAFDNKTIYRENENNELSSIEKYDSQGVLISNETLDLRNSQLTLKNFEDECQNLLVCERYIYNEQGKCIEKKVYSDVLDLSQKIENDSSTNEMFDYLNSLLVEGNFPKIQELAESYFGPLYLLMAGYYNHPLEAGIFGYGEASDKVRITFINGILNRNRDCMETAQLISKAHGGTNIHYIYRPTSGWANDLMTGVPVRFGMVTPQATLLANTWKELISEMGGVDSGAIIIHYAHSIGASDTWNARTLLSAEEKSMIRVITIGSPFLIHKDGLHSVVNYVSLRDGVSMLDPFGYYNGHYDEDSNVVFLGKWRDGWPIIDHPIYSPTYTALLHKLGQEFTDSFGTVCP